MNFKKETLLPLTKCNVKCVINIIRSRLHMNMMTFPKSMQVEAGEAIQISNDSRAFLILCFNTRANIVRAHRRKQIQHLLGSHSSEHNFIHNNL